MVSGFRGVKQTLPPATLPHYFSDSGDLDAIYCTQLNCVYVWSKVSCVISNKVVMDFGVEPSSRDVD